MMAMIIGLNAQLMLPPFCAERVVKTLIRETFFDPLVFHKRPIIEESRTFRIFSLLWAFLQSFDIIDHRTNTCSRTHERLTETNGVWTVCNMPRKGLSSCQWFKQESILSAL